MFIGVYAINALIAILRVCLEVKSKLAEKLKYLTQILELPVLVSVGLATHHRYDVGGKICFCDDIPMNVIHEKYENVCMYEARKYVTSYLIIQYVMYALFFIFGVVFFIRYCIKKRAIKHEIEHEESLAK